MRLTHSLTVIGATAAMLVGGVVAAPTASAASRTVELYTKDAAPGGYAKMTVNWYNNSYGAYKGTVTGVLTDREADGWCVQTFVIEDGDWVRQKPTACPKGEWQRISHTYHNVRNVQVAVCLVKNPTGAASYCRIG
ncbi:hypothetical protein [Streptomyces beigongshangae]|uniref:hypothetical protein n=1 Tax=Streptomyces beigongshangae TaxID=2841597 RepID=UPI001C866275|nr:hypothetical protein [Streptomyces sp. REN17]